MNERRDDTTKSESESRPARRSYYYDDAAGYETYRPEDVDEDEAESMTDGAREEDIVQPRGDVQSCGEEENARSRKRRESVDE